MSNLDFMKNYVFKWYNDLCLKQIVKNVNLRHNECTSSLGCE